MSQAQTFRILIVDDSEFYGRQLGRLLSSPRTEIVKTLSAEEARNRMREVRPDLAIIDVFLGTTCDGGSNQLAFVECQDIPVIRLSSDPANAEECIAPWRERFCKGRSCTGCLGTCRARALDKADLRVIQERVEEVRARRGFCVS